ncbi:heterokaryon incompatibility protein-domain-containing protein [Aspergillus bertholletiae]|uniref:Heterokaryon incompatibility protein-domain-containing protein n=1 Tax=Aspergillus bertholletiae TaxID=1226010 RepID=A0A5N7B8M0_9EURO|nr:heterokaryon incompatibility protein-domain-containing protein [Aspergillus bertholletiae]
MGDNALGVLIGEAMQISSSHSLRRIICILQCIDHLLSLEDSTGGYEAVGVLRTFQIFPVQRGDDWQGVRSCEPRENWFIADQPHLRATFHGHLNLLAFDVEVSARMSRLFRALHLEDRLLSRAASCRLRSNPAFRVRDNYRSLLLSQAEYISRLARDHGFGPWESLALLQDIQVRSVNDVDVEWVIRSPSGVTIPFNAGRRSALLVRDDNHPYLYIRDRDAEAHSLHFEVCEELSHLFGVPLEHICLLWAALQLNDTELWDNAGTRGEAFQAIDYFNNSSRVDQPSNRNGLSSSGETSIQPIQSTTVHDAVSLTSEAAENPKVSTQIDTYAPSLNTVERQPALSKAKANWIEQWCDSSVPLSRSADSIPVSPISIDDTPSGEQSPSYSSSLSELSPWSCSVISETHSRDTQLLPIRDQLPGIGSAEQSEYGEGSIARVADSYYRQRAPSSTTIPGVIICSTEDELPPVDFEGGIIQGQATLPARLQMLDNGVETIFIASHSTTLIDYEPEFMGEVFVSEFLRHVLGSKYNPNQHWTSPWRTRLGHAPFTASSNHPGSSFYLDPITGQAMTELLKAKSLKRVPDWKVSRPDYHIDVRTTVDDASASFSWSPHHFDMIRRWRIRGSSPQQDHIYILIRVSNIHGNPRARMFVDPWAMIKEGELQIITPSNLVVNIHDGGHPGIELTRFAGMKEEQPHEGVYKLSKLLLSTIYHPPTMYPPQGQPVVYVWESLRKASKSIRLLHLWPGAAAEDLRGNLTISTLTEESKYDALSYTWGSTLQPFILYTSDGEIPITTSLYLALRRMRKRNETIYLWVDAICINQSDNAEKVSQISMMPEIFRLATHVYAWIGEEQDDSPKVIEALSRIAKQGVPSLQQIVPIGSSTFWNNLGKLLQRKWFRRIWVVQEIVLARDIIVVCGGQRIKWDEFCDVVSSCFDYADQCRPGRWFSRNDRAGSVLHLAQFRKECRVHGGFAAKYPLLTLFEHFQLTEATRRRDKLFALLNLASDDHDELRPDYDAPLEDIIWRYVCTFEARGQMMELLYRSGRSLASRFPSWVPDWTSAPYPRTLSRWKCKSRPYRFAAAGRSHYSGYLHPKRFLCLKGRLVDRISRVGVRSSHTSTFPAYCEEIYTMVDECLPSLTPEEAALAKQRIPIGDADMIPDGRRTSRIDAISHLNEEERYVAISHDDEWTVPLQAGIATATEFADLFSPAIACCTERRRVGIVPARTRPHDRVAIFQGGRVPFIIRERETQAGHYEVVGECYIDGMMHGEYLELSEQWQEISLV